MANEVPLIERLESMDREIDAWRKMTVQKLQRRLAGLGLKERATLIKSVKGSLRRRNLEIEKVAFSFARHGIFLEYGVGRGRPVKSPQAEAAKKPWLADTLPGQIDELAKILAEEYADITANELRGIIPGADVKVTK
jgi:hypothetical protein